MPEVTDPALLDQLNGGRQRTARPVAILPSPQQDADNSRADAGAANDQIRTGLAIGDNARADVKDKRDADKGVFDRERGLAGEFTRNPEVAAYRATMPNIASALRAPKNGQGDLSIIYAYAKVMDPGSVVRESEMEMASSTSPWAQAKVQELRNQLDGSGRLPDATRRGLEQEMIRKGQALRKSYDGERGRYMADAQAYGLDPQRVVGQHHGDPFREITSAYDEEHGLGRFAPGQPPAAQPPGGGAVSPEMRGGLPIGTQITFDGNGGPQWWDRNKWLMQTKGISVDQESAIVGFYNANRGNQNLTPENVRAWYQQNGLPQPNDDELNVAISQARAGTVDFGPFNDSDAKAARQAELQGMANTLSRNDGTAGANGQFDPNSLAAYGNRAGTGLTLNTFDEISGLSGGFDALMAGKNPVQGYQDTRDAERLRYDQMREQQGVAGHIAEFAGSIPTALVLPGSTVARQAAVGGAAAGWGQGDGLVDSGIGAGGGAGLGGALGKGFEKGGQFVGDRLAARAVGRVDAPTSAQRYANAQEFGLDAVAPGDVGGMGSRAIERGLDVQPGAAGVMGANREKLGGQLTEAVGGVADTFGRPSTYRGAGEALQRGANKWVDETDAISGKLYEAIPIGPEAQAVTANTVGKLEALTNKITSNPKLGAMLKDPRLVGYLDALTAKAKAVPTGLLDNAGNPITREVVEGGGVSWSDLKQLRTRIGEEIGQQMFGEKTLKSDLRGLYGALSQDMEATAVDLGYEALKAFRRANTYYAQRAKRIEDVIEPLLGKDGDRTHEAAAALIQRISKGGKGSGDLKMLAQVRRTLKPDEWGQVQNGLIREMGQPAGAPGRAFSPDTFVRNFGGLEGGGKNILFGKSELRDNLDKFVGVLDGIAKNNGTRNTSNTAVGLSSLIGYGTGGPLGLIGQTITSYGGAKLWTNPAFVRWATGYSKLLGAANRSGAVNPQAHTGQMAALTRLASSHPVIAGEARELMQQLQQAFQGGGGPQRLAAEPGEGQPMAKPTTTEVPR
jgi:hypothetical protein